MASFEFIIDTDSYAGNFERELCAYTTGHWDGETHGGDQAAEFEKEVGDPDDIFEDYITMEPTCDDDAPIMAYHHLEWEPQGKAMNSIGIFFEQEPTREMIALMKDRAIKFSKVGKIFGRSVNFKIIGFRLLKRTENIEKIAV